MVEVLRTYPRVVLIKEETTPGTDATPVPTTDAMLVNEVAVSQTPNVIETNENTGTLDAGERIIGSVPVEISLQFFLKGSGVVDIAPEYRMVYLTAGFKETINVGVDIQYSLTSAKTDIKTATVYVYRDGLLWNIVGCRVSALSWSWDAGGLCTIDATLMGLFNGKTDVAMPTPIHQSTRPPVWLDNVMTIDSVAAAVQQMTLALNNEMTMPENPNSAEGIDPAELTKRDPQGTINPLETLVATRNIMQDFRNGVARPLVATIGQTQFNTISCSIPKARYLDETQGDRNGTLMVDVPFQAVSRDDGIVFTYT